MPVVKMSDGKNAIVKMPSGKNASGKNAKW